MLKFIRKLIISLVLITILVPSTVFALDNPDVLFMKSPILVFRDCFETGDYYFVCIYNIEYDILPEGSVDQAFSSRLLDNDDNIVKTGTLYSFHDEGFGYGVASIYCSSSLDIDETSSYTFEILGNPLLTWTDGVPSMSSSSFEWLGSQYTQEEITEIAYFLQAEWGVTLLSGGKLTTTEDGGGEDYFMGCMPGSDNMAPLLFSSGSSFPVYREREFSKDYSEQLKGQWDGTEYKAYMVSLTNYLGLSDSIWLRSIFWLILLILAIIYFVAISGTDKGIGVFIIPVLLCGMAIGFLEPAVVIIAAMFCIMIIGYILFYKYSS